MESSPGSLCKSHKTRTKCTPTQPYIVTQGREGEGGLQAWVNGREISNKYKMASRSSKKRIKLFKKKVLPLLISLLVSSVPSYGRASKQRAELSVGPSAVQRRSRNGEPRLGREGYSFVPRIRRAKDHGLGVSLL